MTGNLTLLDYQNTGAAFLAKRRHAALFDEMGVGKTAQVIHGANLAKVRHALVVCPHIGMVNWQREIAMWGWHPASAILSNQHTDDPAPWHIINYELLQENTYALTALRERRYDLFAPDECQALKNYGARRTVNVYGKNGIARNADRVWLISGTPAPNHLGELYPLILALFPDVLKADAPTGRPDFRLTYDMFLRQYCRTSVNVRGDVKVLGTKPSMGAVLKTRLSPFMLRRTLRDVLPELPSLRFSSVYLDPRDAMVKLANNGEAQDIWTALQAAAANTGIADPDDALIKALEQMEIEALSTQRRLYGQAKVPLVAELIASELDAGLDKIVVFYHHQEVGKALCVRLARFGAYRIDGSILKRHRQAIIDQFQEDPDMRVILLSLETSATVITLTAAAHVLFAECSWTPSINVQAARRCSRLGQHRPVLARFALLTGSLDEIIVSVQARKARGLAEMFATSDVMETDNAFERA